MSRLPQLLICDDDADYHLAIKHSLKGKYECRSAYDGDEALAIVRNQALDGLLLDVQMRRPDEGLKLIPQIRELDPDLAIVMISGMTDFQTVREAMRLGAADYVPKDFDPNDLAHTIGQALERRSLLQRQEQQNYEAESIQRQHVLVGRSPAIQSLHKLIEKFRTSRANVVITGETGTGKEVVARQLRSLLPDGTLAPFVAVDSSTIQSSMAESLLFGHEKGAFTGAERVTKGLFEEANGGIVYFDEIANMPLEIQSKLLRVLQEKEVTRLGSSRVIELDFRVVCATNRNLEELVRSGQFKDDLLQRLNVLPARTPPLRERPDDIPLLVAHFVRRQGGRNLVFTPEALAVLQAYPWPGNIRELQNVVAYVTTMAETDEIEIADLPAKIREAERLPRLSVATGTTGDGRNTENAQMTASEQSGPHSVGQGFYERVAAFEKELLGREYARFEGNVSKMALALGMDRSHLYTKLREFAIHSARAQKS